MPLDILFIGTCRVGESIYRLLSSFDGSALLNWHKVNNMYKQFLNTALLITVSIVGAALSAQDSTADPRQLVTDFWQATTSAARETSADALIAAAPDVQALYEWMQKGPRFDESVPVGELAQERFSEDGTRFPYAFLIPESYDAARSYPVEFMLHGGVGRSEWESGEILWRRGYDSLKKEDRILVVPAAWKDAYWWQSMQADNLPALLNLLKQNYNVDENHVSLTGVSDGGTGAYFFAFKQPTQWASFLPYIGHPGVLRNASSGGGYRLFFENLINKPLYIVNGEVDRLYPAESVKPFIALLAETGVSHTFKIIKDGGHNTNWLPQEAPLIEAFKAENPRDPFPDHLEWVADRTDRYNRNHWLVVNKRSKRGSPAIMAVTRQDNSFTVSADGAAEFTLLLSPDEVNFNESITVIANGEVVFNDRVSPNASTLLEWAGKDLDRSMLILAELKILLPLE
jgi:dienelactone hydrolase